MAEDRGTGRTTNQMKLTIDKSIFVWCNENLNYPKQLARELNKDLEIVGPRWFEDNYKWAGRKLIGITIDHAANLNDRQWSGYNKALACIR